MLHGLQSLPLLGIDAMDCCRCYGSTMDAVMAMVSITTMACCCRYGLVLLLLLPVAAIDAIFAFLPCYRCSNILVSF
jgi:hypothetical protein